MSPNFSESTSKSSSASFVPDSTISAPEGGLVKSTPDTEEIPIAEEPRAKSSAGVISLPRASSISRSAWVLPEASTSSSGCCAGSST